MKTLLKSLVILFFIASCVSIAAAQGEFVDIGMNTEKTVTTVQNLPGLSAGLACPADYYCVVMRITPFSPGRRYEATLTFDAGTDIGYSHSWVDGNPYGDDWYSFVGIGTGTGATVRIDKQEKFLFTIDPGSTSGTLYITLRANKSFTFRFGVTDSLTGVNKDSLDKWGYYYVSDFDADKYSPFLLKRGTRWTNVYANFTGYGFYNWNGTAWSKINTVVAANITASSTDLYATFTGYTAFYKWNGTAWSKINTVTPVSMTASGTDLYASFTGYGTYKYVGTTWTRINTVAASNMTASSSDLYATFTGYAGLYKWNGTAWSKINTVTPVSMTASAMDLYANFTGYGLYKWNCTAWSRINTIVSSGMTASSTDLYATFTGYTGLYKWNGTAWSKINTVTPVSMTASSTDLYATFTGYPGLYKWNGTVWSKINTVTPVSMAGAR